jgi:hypothetical protein
LRGRDTDSNCDRNSTVANTNSYIHTNTYCYGNRDWNATMYRHGFEREL